MQLSKHFTLEEFTFSQQAIRFGIDNNPSDQIIFNLKILCENCLEPLREKLGKPLYISSGYRCKQLNTLIGGSKTSSHMIGQAADIKVKGIDTEFLFNEIIGSDIKFDQLIQEFDSWVHISCTTKNRNQIMRAIIENGKTKYLLL